jgi:hypothetical protein
MSWSTGDDFITQHFVEDWDVDIGNSASAKQQETEQHSKLKGRSFFRPNKRHQGSQLCKKVIPRR